MAEFGEVLGGESKVSSGAKLRIIRDALTTFVILGPKGLNSTCMFCSLSLALKKTGLKVRKSWKQARKR